MDGLLFCRDMIFVLFVVVRTLMFCLIGLVVLVAVDGLGLSISNADSLGVRDAVNTGGATGL